MSEEFQPRVDAWMNACFGDKIKADRVERADRFIEEALELAQTIDGFGACRAHALVDYVFGRSVGNQPQEVGGVMVTLAALCNAVSLDMADCGEKELARVWTKVEAIRAKQAAKPTGSALPVVTHATDAENQRLRAEVEALREALAVKAWPPSDTELQDMLASIVEVWWSPSSANLLRQGRRTREDVKAMYALRGVIAPYVAALTRKAPQ